MVSAPEPGLYVGKVRHRRRRPRAHAFTYPLFMAFLDVDRIQELCRVSPFLSYGRWNWAAFHEADQFGDQPALRQVLPAADRKLRAHGVDPAGL